MQLFYIDVSKLFWDCCHFGVIFVMVSRTTAALVLLVSTLHLTHAQSCGRCIHGTCSGGVCVCNTGYEGSACNTNINDCYGITACGARGKCIDGLNSFTCLCNTGFEGPFCNTHTACKINYCENGGTCSMDPEYPEDYICTCAPGLTGKRCELGIPSAAENIAYTKLAGVWGASDGWSGRHEFAVDNKITKNHGANGTFCQHSADGDLNPYVEIVLDNEYPIKTVTVYNRIDGGLGNRFKNITVYVGGSVCATWNQPDSTMYYKDIIDMYCPDGMRGNSVKIQRSNGSPLSVCEVQLFTGVVQH